MTVNVEFWDLVKLLLAFFVAVGAFGKLLLWQIDSRLNDRFSAQDKARTEGSAALRKSIDEHLDEEKEQAKRRAAFESGFRKDMLDMRERVSGVEVAVQNSFDRQDVEGIYNRINEVAEGLSELRGESRGVADTVRLILNQITQKGMQ